jgi:predicted dinucleotide-binding enzyme
MTESVWVSEQLGRPVTKAFNNILAHSLAALGKPKGQPGRLAVAVAGDDGEAKAIASGIVDDMGFDVVDAGSLEDSWRIQPSTPAYCCDFDASEMQRAIAAARKGEAPSKRDRMMSDYGSRLGPDADHTAIVALNRELNAPSR